MIKLTIGVSFWLFCSPVAADIGDKEIKMLYHQLDSLIERQADMVVSKEARIKTINTGMSGLDLSEEQQLAINNRLYDEYMAFKFDSAWFYISKNVSSERLSDNHDLKAASLIRMSHILAVSGLFDKAGKMLEAIDPMQISTQRRIEYYDQCGELNLYRSEMAQNTPYFSEYIDSTQYYRQLILQIAPKESYEYIFNSATYLCEKGDTKRAIRMLEETLPTLVQGERRYSIVTSTLAYFHSRKGEPEMQEYYLLLSAISDMRGAILENNSLRELSAILMKRGDHKKAYQYLQQANMDAQAYGSRLRSLQVARLSPLITQAYDMERAQTQRRTSLLLIVISVIALLLIGSMWFVLSLMRKRRMANEKIRVMNQELSSQNKEMEMMNNLMKESNRIKDEYIGRFLELSSSFIARGEGRHKQLNRLARERNMEQLYAELKNQKPLNESVRLFHQNFDTAFLNIYPHFITEVNRLMSDGNQFDLSANSDRLTTELRVLALIRLGITDNQKIADILKSSLTTIYTYRSRMKSRAINKDSFEDDVTKIATY